jgi:biopolymer transport protein ExbD
MPSLRSIKKLPKLDMNPMVDMAFLLVSFFMMTTTFKSDMPTEIVIPSSHSELKLPDKDLCTITIDQEGRVFIGLDNKFDRKQMLSYVLQSQQIALSRDDAERFSLLHTFGVAFKDLPVLAGLEKEDRKGFDQEGIPIEDEQNELKHWIIGSRMANPNLRFAINGDRHTPVATVRRVFDILQDLNITRFNLITDKKIDAS